jgi:hypothetical protein
MLDKNQTMDEEILNLNTPAGIQAIPMAQVASVRFLNPTLESEFQRALGVLASSHDTQKKSVSVGFNGQGKRAVRVGYVVERPIWKTTYRLRLDPNGKVFLQGWALVENTSDDDWNDVRMVLVSGKPISFKMNLYDPIYIPRPLVEPEMFASLRPPVYNGALAEAALPPQGRPMLNGGPGASKFIGALVDPPPALSGMGGGGFALPDSRNSYVRPQEAGVNSDSSFVPQSPTMPMPALPPACASPSSAPTYNLCTPLGLAPNQGPQQQAQQNLALNSQPGNKLTYDELQRRRREQGGKAAEAMKLGSAIAGFNFKEGIQSVATSDEIGDYFQYAIDQKVTLPRQKSAMLPILDQSIEGLKVSIYNESIHAKYPLLGLKLKNTSGQPLTQGPITVYDGGVFAGDTRILDLQPNEERLLSYALDQGTEVKTEIKQAPSPNLIFRIGADNLSARYELRQTKTYTIKNRSTHDRQVMLEHPLRADWKLVEPKKPAEKTRELYRFLVSVPAGKNVAFDVVEEQTRVDNVALQGQPPYPVANGIVNVGLQGGQPSYAVANGINLKVVTNVDQHKLVGLKIVKGLVLPTHKIRETKAYFVQNLSDQDRTFTVDHVIRPGWIRLDDAGDSQPGPEVFRFKLAVDKSKTGQQAVREERTLTAEGTLLQSVSETQLRGYLASTVPSAEVKAAFTKALGMQARVAETQKQFADVEKQLKTLNEDQARVRENLKIIPPSSEHHKTFLEKFVGQEKEIETLQNTIRQINATLQGAQREYGEFLAKLNAE